MDRIASRVTPITNTTGVFKAPIAPMGNAKWPMTSTHYTRSHNDTVPENARRDTLNPRKIIKGQMSISGLSHIQSDSETARNISHKAHCHNGQASTPPRADNNEMELLGETFYDQSVGSRAISEVSIDKDDMRDPTWEPWKPLHVTRTTRKRPKSFTSGSETAKKRRPQHQRQNKKSLSSSSTIMPMPEPGQDQAAPENLQARLEDKQTPFARASAEPRYQELSLPSPANTQRGFSVCDIAIGTTILKEEQREATDACGDKTSVQTEEDGTEARNGKNSMKMERDEDTFGSCYQVGGHGQYPSPIILAMV